jgi:spermidine synthase
VVELDPAVIALARDILELDFEQMDPGSETQAKRRRTDQAASSTGALECVEADAVDWLREAAPQQAHKPHLKAK